MLYSFNYLALSTISVASHRVGNSWEWYVIRAAGFIAAGLLMLLMLSGIGQVTGLTYKYIEPVKAWALHKAMALALVVTIIIHVTFLLFDHYIKFTIPQVLIPFLSKYNNKTNFGGLALSGLAVTFGIVAMYGVFIIVLSSLGWIDTKKKAWHRLHYLGYFVVLMLFLHGLYTGTDLRYGVFRMAWIFAGLIVFVAILMRVIRAGVLTKKHD